MASFRAARESARAEFDSNEGYETIVMIRAQKLLKAIVSGPMVSALEKRK